MAHGHGPIQEKIPFLQIGFLQKRLCHHPLAQARFFVPTLLSLVTSAHCLPGRLTHSKILVSSPCLGKAAQVSRNALHSCKVSKTYCLICHSMHYNYRDKLCTPLVHHRYRSPVQKPGRRQRRTVRIFNSSERTPSPMMIAMSKRVTRISNAQCWTAMIVLTMGMTLLALRQMDLICSGWSRSSICTVIWRLLLSLQLTCTMDKVLACDMELCGSSTQLLNVHGFVVD